MVGVVSRGQFHGGQVFPHCHHTWHFDHQIALSWCEFCGNSCSFGTGFWNTTACSCRTSVCGSMLMLRMRQRKSLTRQRLCSASWEAFLSVVTESCQLLVGEHLICLLGRYCQLFHCEVFHQGTSVKVQDVGLLSVKVPGICYPRFSL